MEKKRRPISELISRARSSTLSLDIPGINEGGENSGGGGTCDGGGGGSGSGGGSGGGGGGGGVGSGGSGRGGGSSTKTSIRPASSYTAGATDATELFASPLIKDRVELLKDLKPYDNKDHKPYDNKDHKPYDNKDHKPYDNNELSLFSRDHPSGSGELLEEQRDARERFYEDKSDLKEKFAQVRTRTTAMESALKEEIQRLRERRVLPTPSGLRGGSTVIIGHPM